VILTTYDVITGPDFSVFRNIPRWEMLVVDEGQRRKLATSDRVQADETVKSDSSLIFNRLKTLNTVHRILLTGTPLNNNLRELFNLLNFLDPVNFR
jgi:SNF2 family DNA or RNA helicase